jgi:hypothetical protein
MRAISGLVTTPESHAPPCSTSHVRKGNKENPAAVRDFLHKPYEPVALFLLWGEFADIDGA